MPYPPEHKQRTRGRIVEAAGRLFRTHGYDGVGIDRIMAEAGLTRGGFYAHFSGKDELFAEAIAGSGPSPDMRSRLACAEAAPGGWVRAFIEAYLSSAHRHDVATGCPLVALSPDVSRAGTLARRAYTRTVRDAVERFADDLPEDGAGSRARAYGILAMCVGGMVLGRAVEGEAEADTILAACQQAARELAGLDG